MKILAMISLMLISQISLAQEIHVQIASVQRIGTSSSNAEELNACISDKFSVLLSLQEMEALNEKCDSDPRGHSKPFLLAKIDTTHELAEVAIESCEMISSSLKISERKLVYKKVISAMVKIKENLERLKNSIIEDTNFCVPKK